MSAVVLTGGSGKVRVTYHKVKVHSQLFCRVAFIMRLLHGFLTHHPFSHIFSFFYIGRFSVPQKSQSTPAGGLLWTGFILSFKLRSYSSKHINSTSKWRFQFESDLLYCVCICSVCNATFSILLLNKYDAVSCQVGKRWLKMQKQAWNNFGVVHILYPHVPKVVVSSSCSQ